MKDSMIVIYDIKDDYTLFKKMVDEQLFEFTHRHIEFIYCHSDIVLEGVCFNDYKSVVKIHYYDGSIFIKLICFPYNDKSVDDVYGLIRTLNLSYATRNN